jgi:hypothetical protein
MHRRTYERLVQQERRLRETALVTFAIEHQLMPSAVGMDLDRVMD